MRSVSLAVVAIALAAMLASLFFASAPSTRPSGSTTAQASVARPESILALFEAVKQDDLPTARNLLSQDGSITNSRNELGETPLHLVRSRAMAQLLLDQGADLQARDRQHNARPVRYAASDWRIDIIQLLEQRGGPDEDVFYYAATGKADQLGRALLEKPERLESRSEPGDVLGGGRHLMHIAATYGQTNCCSALLNAGADVNVGGGWNDSQPLENAAWAGFPETVKLLVSQGADLEARDAQMLHTALWYSATTARREVVEILLNAGAKIEDGLVPAVRDARKSPYPGRDLPPREEYDKVIQILLEHGAKDTTSPAPQ